MQPLNQLVDLYIVGSYGYPIPVRFCIRCAAPRLGATTTAGLLQLQLTQVDVPRILGFAFGLIIAILNVAFGSLVGGQLGLLIVLTGILAGAGITVAFAASIALGQNRPTQ